MARRRHSKKRSRAGGLLLTLFGLPFLTVGCFASYRAVSLLWLWQDTKGWTETEARITQVDLKKHSSDDGYTYEVVCTYTYEFDGQSYTCERVGLETTADNIGDWHQQTHQKLKTAHGRDEPVRCYVDPNQPQRAVLFRELRFGILMLWLMFGFVFSLAGLGIVAGGMYTNRTAARTAKLRSVHPGKPWLWKKEWAGGRIRAATGLKAVVMWGVAGFWNGISWPIVALLVPEAILREGQYWTLVFLIFPVIGLGLLVTAFRQTVQHFKFGRSYLQLTTLPGVIGGQLTGDLVLRGRLGALQVVDVALRCVREVTTGSGKNRSTTKQTLWENTRHYDSVSVFGQHEASLTIDFDIPIGKRPSGDDIDWLVKVTGDVPGVDVDLEFNVPVFGTDRDS